MGLLSVVLFCDDSPPFGSSGGGGGRFTELCNVLLQSPFDDLFDFLVEPSLALISGHHISLVSILY